MGSTVPLKQRFFCALDLIIDLAFKVRICIKFFFLIQIRNLNLKDKINNRLCGKESSIKL